MRHVCNVCNVCNAGHLPPHHRCTIVASLSRYGHTSPQPLDDDDFGDGDDLVLGADVKPLLADAALYNENTASAIALYWAPRPFNMRSGFTRRCIDIPLVNAWFQEHCPPSHPVKVRAS